MKQLKKIFFLLGILAFIGLNILQLLTIKADVQTKRVELSIKQRTIEISPQTDSVKEFKTVDEAKFQPPKDDAAKQAAEAKAVDYKTANLAIILTEVGTKKEDLELALKALPKEVSLAFNPYSDELKNKMLAQVGAGREVLLNLMFEPSNFPINDTGPFTIQSYLDEVQKSIKLQNTFVQADGYKGVLSNSDEILTHNFENISPVLKILKNKELFFCYYRKPVNANLENDIKPIGLDAVIVDYLIDEKSDKESIEKKLNEVSEEIIKNKQRIVIALRTYPVSVKVLSKWLKQNLGENIQVAPISYFIVDN